MALNPQLQQIGSKLQLLIKQFTVQKKQNQQLKLENEKLLKIVEQLKGEINVLHEKNAISKIGSVTQVAEGKKELENQINLYLREIDKCLASLNN